MNNEYEKALDKIQEGIGYYEWIIESYGVNINIWSIRLEKEVALMRETVGKMTPKKLIKDTMFNGDRQCPTCEAHLYDEYDNPKQWDYCPRCSQALDRSKDE